MSPSLRRNAVLLALVGFIALSVLAVQAREAAATTVYGISDTAPFLWTDISGTGTNLSSLSTCDDCYESDVPIGFTFTFDVTDYTVLEPTTNGVISLDQENNDEYDNNEYGPLPTSEWSGAALFPFWDDLYPPEAGDIYVETVGSAPNRAFIVQYDNITSYDEEGASYVATFQAALCEGSNNIVFQYEDTVFGKPSYPEHDNGGDATVGIQKTSAEGFLYSHNSPAITDGLAIVFYPVGGSPTNCLAGVPAPTPTATATPLPTDAPPASTVAPTETSEAAGEPTATVAAVTLPETGVGGSGPGNDWTWPIVALVSAGVVAAAGYATLRLRNRRA